MARRGAALGRGLRARGLGCDELGFDDESHPVADAARNLIAVGSAIVPPLWWYEVRNAALAGERRGRLKLSDTAQLADLPIVADSSADETIAFRMARQHNLTFHDASYLALAYSRDVPLATLDRALIAAAPREDVELIATR